MFTLASPAWLLLLPAWLGYLWFTRHWRNSDQLGGSAVTLAHPNLGALLNGTDTPSPNVRRRPWLDDIAALLLVVALAQPQWIGAALPDTPDAREIVLVVDVSQTMSIRDFEVDAKPVDRLSVLKNIVGRFVTARQGDRFGVIAFGNIAATLVPPTFDARLVVTMLERMQAGIAGDDTAIGDAIGLALKQLRGDAHVRPALILFTDGANTAGDLSLHEAIELARRMTVPVYTVQIGGDAAAPSNADATLATEPGLPQVAAWTGGRYYTADTTTALHDVIRDIGALEKSVLRSSGQRLVREWYLLPLLLAATLLTLTRVAQLRRLAI